MGKMVLIFFWLFTYLRTIQNTLMTCWLSDERLLPFGLLVIKFVEPSTLYLCFQSAIDPVMHPAEAAEQLAALRQQQELLTKLVEQQEQVSWQL